MGQFKVVPRNDLSAAQIHHFFAALEKACGIKLSSHRLRHTVGSEIVRMSGNIKMVRQLFNHSTIAVSAIYAEQDIEALRLVLDAANVSVP